MIIPSRTRPVLGIAMLALSSAALPPSPLRAQIPKSAQTASQPQSIVTVEQPNAQRAKDEFSALLDHYPPALRSVLALDPESPRRSVLSCAVPGPRRFLNAPP